MRTITPRRNPHESYILQAHFEMSAYLINSMDKAGTLANDTFRLFGRKGLYDLATQLADYFENAYPFQGRLHEDDFAQLVIRFLVEREMEPRASQSFVVERSLKYSFDYAFASAKSIEDFGSVQVGDRSWKSGELIPFRYLQDGDETQFQVFVLGEWQNAHRDDFILVHEKK